MGLCPYTTFLLLVSAAVFTTVNAYADLTTGNAPLYTAAGVVQAATQTGGALAPNTLTTIYGTNLSWTTQAAAAGDLVGGSLPTSLDGVTVYADNMMCGLIFVSPGQINFLLPYEIVGSSATVIIVRQGLAGPPVTIPFAIAAPGFFQWNGNFAVAQHADGSLITETTPAAAGETIVLYATGLGRTTPDLPSGHIASTAVSILYLSKLQVLLNGVACPASSIYYAGVTPGFAGLYQINLTLPAGTESNPTIQLVLGAQSSPPGIQLYVR